MINRALLCLGLYFLALQTASAESIIFSGSAGIDIRKCRDIDLDENNPVIMLRDDTLAPAERINKKPELLPAYSLTPPPPPGPDVSIEPIECNEPLAEPGFPPFPLNPDLPSPLLKQPAQHKGGQQRFIPYALGPGVQCHFGPAELPQKHRSSAKTIVLPADCEPSAKEITK